MLSAALVAVAPTLVTAAPGESQVPIANPDMQQACGMDALVVLDESGSVGNYAPNVRAAFRAFYNALNNTGSRIGVVEFSSTANLPLPGAARQTYTSVTPNSISTIFNPYITTNYNPGGSTNWEDALRVGRYFLPRPSATRPHITVFITDGDPNATVENPPPNGDVTYLPGSASATLNEYERKVPLTEDDETDDAGSTTAKNRAVSNANGLKAMGSHVLAIAVGSGLTSDESLDRLIDVSGPQVLTSGQAFTPQTDVYRVPNFAELEQGLRELAFALCAPVVNVQKFIDLTPDPDLPGQAPDLIPGAGWEMTGVVSPTPVSWAQPAGTPPNQNTAVGLTGGDGSVAFDWRPSSSGLQTITVTEEDPAGVPPPPGFENDPADTSCTFRTATQPADRPLPITAVVGGFTANVSTGAIVTCQMINRAPPAPSIDIEKSTNGDDADDPTGPFVPIVDGDEVTWTYAITNTGNVTLSGVAITDTVGAGTPTPVTGCATELAPGESDTCEVVGDAIQGQYENTGAVSGTDPFGTVVTDSDLSHYVGVVAGIDIEKATNGVDADLAPGPLIAVGGTVNWTYVVTNTGDTTINDIVVTDSQGVAVTCPSDTLPPAPGANSMPCTAPAATATAGQYENIGSVTGEDTEGTVVQDSDASHYFGEAPDVTIEKLTGTDPADDPTGPLFSVGEVVTWIYRIENTGNVPLIAWEVTDDQALDAGPGCPRLGILGVGRVVFCHGSALAVAGQHENIGTVTATSPAGTVVTDSNPANYFGVEGNIDIEKFTNGEDADQAPGPYVLVGSTVNWTYVVTNTGNSVLSGIEVIDHGGVVVSCPSDTLPPTAGSNSMTCTGSALAVADQYTNLASVEGTDPIGVVVRDEDPSHYFGGVPEIDLQKFTNGSDSDEPTGLFIPVDDDVTWNYIVTNTGTAALTGLVVTDDQGVEVTCPATTIPAGESVTCTASGTAQLGQYSNLGTASATSQVGDVSDDDPSHYFGFISEIHVEKYVNGEDADEAPGIELEANDAITWIYEVTNPGNILIRDVVLVDDQGLVPVLVTDDGDLDADLDPGETWTYEASSTAVAGLHTNIATVTGLDLLEEPVSDEDPANYTAAGPLPATIGDLVWEDPNSNQVQDAGEPGIAGARISITNDATGEEQIATSDADGHYRVQGPPGDYTVVLDMDSIGSTLTTPGSYEVTVAEGDIFLDADFGVIEDDEELPNTAHAPPLPLSTGGLLFLMGVGLVLGAVNRLAFAHRRARRPQLPPGAP